MQTGGSPFTRAHNHTQRRSSACKRALNVCPTGRAHRLTHKGWILMSTLLAGGIQSGSLPLLLPVLHHPEQCLPVHLREEAVRPLGQQDPPACPQQPDHPVRVPRQRLVARLRVELAGAHVVLVHVQGEVLEAPRLSHQLHGLKQQGSNALAPGWGRGAQCNAVRASWLGRQTTHSQGRGQTLARQTGLINPTSKK